MREITDGLSKTMFMSEVIMAPRDEDFDVHGDIINNHFGAAQFFTRNPPNGGVDMVLCSQQLIAPCQNTDGPSVSVSARSLHPGGVNVMFGDVSVRFMVNGINLQAWQAMGSMDFDDIAIE